MLRVVVDTVSLLSTYYVPDSVNYTTIPRTTKRLYIGISTRKVNSHLNHGFVCSSVHVCKQRTTQIL